MTPSQERSSFTPQERKLAREMSLTTRFSLREAFSVIEECRGHGVTPERVEKYAAEQNIDLLQSADLLQMAAVAARQFAPDAENSGSHSGSTHDVERCEDCPGSQHRSYFCTVDHVVTGNWRDHAGLDQPVPKWCPLRGGAITIRLKKEEAR